MRPFPTDSLESADIWENELLQEVCRTVKEVWGAAGKPKNVLLAVDGVVPMAKIRQQRVRRFKSAWLRQASSVVAWDSNSITPGTAFMERLGLVLKVLCDQQGKSWIVSGVNERGEGEHKILKWLRACGSVANDDNIIIYGLDADLILLAMLTGEQLGCQISLLREKQEFGDRVMSDTQEYTFLSINELKKRVGVSGYHHVMNYIGLMSLMGNDFLPHSLTHKLSDDGHECVIRELRRMTQSKEWLVTEDGKAVHDVLKGVVGRWSIDEGERMFEMIKGKQEQARRGLGKRYANEPLEGLPLEWNVEKAMLSGEMRTILLPEWRDVYYGWASPSLSRQGVCQEYLRGFQWILDYYTGRPVDTTWMFPYWIPPLWSDLAASETPTAFASATSAAPTADPSPQEQLAMVLPLESWGLVRDQALRRLPALCPQMWPASFVFFSAGRKWLWECEALVPVLTAGRVREVLKSTR